jgi:hypothetical protein
MTALVGNGRLLPRRKSLLRPAHLLDWCRRYGGGLPEGFWNRELKIELAGLSHEPIALDTELRTLDVAFPAEELVVPVVVVVDVVVAVVPVG